MTVYFVCSVGDPSMVKIGVTDHLDSRMSALGREFEAGIELLACCEGGREAEAIFHSIFRDAWIEGEWFRRSEQLQRTIANYASGVTGRRIWGRLRAVETAGACPHQRDREIVYDELHKLLGRFGVSTLGVSHRKALSVLQSINPAWTHRRVRAIWERGARRIDLFEYRDLQTANALTESEIQERLAA